MALRIAIWLERVSPLAPSMRRYIHEIGSTPALPHGAALIGPDVTELLAELSIVKMLEGTPTEIGLTVHAHPTLSEGIKEAALASSNEAIHWV